MPISPTCSLRDMILGADIIRCHLAAMKAEHTRAGLPPLDEDMARANCLWGGTQGELGCQRGPPGSKAARGSCKSMNTLEQMMPKAKRQAAGVSVRKDECRECTGFMA